MSKILWSFLLVTMTIAIPQQSLQINECRGRNWNKTLQAEKGVSGLARSIVSAFTISPNRELLLEKLNDPKSLLLTYSAPANAVGYVVAAAIILWIYLCCISICHNWFCCCIKIHSRQHSCVILRFAQVLAFVSCGAVVACAWHTAFTVPDVNDSLSSVDCSLGLAVSDIYDSNNCHEYQNQSFKWSGLAPVYKEGMEMGIV